MVKRPAHTLIVGDAQSTADPDIGSSGLYTGDTGSISFRHNGKMNLLYVDGHVSSLKRPVWYAYQYDWRYLPWDGYLQGQYPSPR
jgi:prepilin-type processing-associated H-X9-DG protein